MESEDLSKNYLLDDILSEYPNLSQQIEEKIVSYLDKRIEEYITARPHEANNSQTVMLRHQNNLIEENKKLNNELQQVLSDKTRMADEVKKLKEKLKENKKLKNELKQRLEDDKVRLVEEIKKLREKLKDHLKLEKEIAQVLTHEKASLAGELNELKSKIKENKKLVNEIEKLQYEKAQVDEEVKKLRDQLLSAWKTNVDLQKEIMTNSIRYRELYKKFKIAKGKKNTEGQCLDEIPSATQQEDEEIINSEEELEYEGSEDIEDHEDNPSSCDEEDERFEEHEYDGSEDMEEQEDTSSCDEEDESFKSGNYVLLKSDVKWDGDKIISKLDDLTLFKIECKVLLQKYVPMEYNGKILHEVTVMFTGWCYGERNRYYSVTKALDTNPLGTEVKHEERCVALDLNDLINVIKSQAECE